MVHIYNFPSPELFRQNYFTNINGTTYSKRVLHFGYPLLIRVNVQDVTTDTRCSTY